MNKSSYNVLFLCTGNSARSIFGEVLINALGGGTFHGFSAGSNPKGQVHPATLEILQNLNFPIDGLRSKSWEEFETADAPKMDFVFTVCDQAAAEVCPVWPGQPMTAHWGIADPAAVTDDPTRQRKAFHAALMALQNRIRLFTSLPIASIDRLRLQHELEEIGHTPETRK